MKKYNIILLGGSNSIMSDGLQKGLKQENINLINLSLGATGAVQNLYELKREKNQLYFENCDLIISEFNVNFSPYNTVNIMCEELAKLRKKVLIILLPYLSDSYQKIYRKHIELFKKFNFNLIDMSKYYEENNLYSFHRSYDPAHPQSQFMFELGKNIITNIENFKNGQEVYIENYDFKICYSNELVIKEGKVVDKNHKNSMFDEKILRTYSSTVLKFPKKYYGYKIIAVHTWNKNAQVEMKDGLYNISNISIKNKNYFILKPTVFLNSVADILNEFIIEEDTFIACDSRDMKYTEDNVIAKICNKKTIIHNTLDLVGFLLLKPLNYKIIFKHNDYEFKLYDFNHIIPPIKWYKEIITTYCMRVDSKKIVAMQKQNNQIQTQYGTAKSRIQNQLSYKLGQTMIINSKNIFGILFMPVYITSTLLSHRQEKKIYQEKIKKDPSLKLPPLESYPDYKEALKFKNHLSYKLGQALIKANKTWYKGGYIKLWFEIRRLKREFIGKEKYGNKI